METLHGRALALAAWLLLVAGTAAGQTLSNPDIGVIGDMRVIARTDKAADSLGVNSPEFVFHELELSYNAHLNPYMRADVFLGIHHEDNAFELHIEEANFTVLRGLPLSLQANAGIFLLDFGRLNAQHAHLWGWMERPLMSVAFLGEEGLSATGVRLNTLLGIGDNSVTLSATAFSSDAFAPHEHDADHEHEDAAAEVMGSGRASLFRQFGDAWSAELGVSAMLGEYDPAEGLSLTQGAADWKLRWRPDGYRSLSWVAEVMSGRRDVVADETAGTTTEVDATGAFTSLEVQWRKRWSAGAFFDWTEDTQVAGAETTAVGAFAGFSPVEETARIGLAYRHQTSDFTDYADDSITLQFLWSLGPHKVHSF